MISTTFSLCDHILKNAACKMSQQGVVDVGLSDHQFICCTYRSLMIKANMYNQIWVWSLKKYILKLLIKELKNNNFLNYYIFSNVNIASLDLVEKT